MDGFFWLWVGALIIQLSEKIDILPPHSQIAKLLLVVYCFHRLPSKYQHFYSREEPNHDIPNICLSPYSLDLP
jgi:hypothetical protein